MGIPGGGGGGGGQGGSVPPPSNKCLLSYSTLSQYYYVHAHNGIEAKIEWS